MRKITIKRKTIILIASIMAITIPVLYLIIRIVREIPFDVVVANVTTSTADIYWKSRSGEKPILSYREKSSNSEFRYVNDISNIKDISTRSRVNIQKISDLSPSKEYIFRIQSRDRIVVKEITFVTSNVEERIELPKIKGGRAAKGSLVLITVENEKYILDTENHGTWSFDSKGKKFDTRNYATYFLDQSLGKKLKDVLEAKDIYLFKKVYAEENNSCGNDWWNKPVNCRKNIKFKEDAPTINITPSEIVANQYLNFNYGDMCNDQNKTAGRICYPDVFCRALEKNIDPAIVFAIWMQESAGSNYKAIKYFQPENETFGVADFGITAGNTDRCDFNAQLGALLNILDNTNYLGSSNLKEYSASVFGLKFSNGFGIDYFLKGEEYYKPTPNSYKSFFLFYYYYSFLQDSTGKYVGFPDNTEDHESANNLLQKFNDIEKKVQKIKKSTLLNEEKHHCLDYLFTKFLYNEGLKNKCPQNYVEEYENVYYYKIWEEIKSIIASRKEYDKERYLGKGKEKSDSCKNAMENESVEIMEVTEGNEIKIIEGCCEDYFLSGDNYKYNGYAQRLAVNYCRLTSGQNLYKKGWPFRAYDDANIGQEPAEYEQICDVNDTTQNTESIACPEVDNQNFSSSGSSGSTGDDALVIGNPGPGNSNNGNNNGNGNGNNNNGNNNNDNDDNDDNNDPNNPKVCCQDFTNGLSYIKKDQCTGNGKVIREDRNKQQCNSKTISYDFRTGYNFIQIQEIHNTAAVQISTAKQLLEKSQGRIIGISKFVNNKWTDTLLSQDGNLYGNDFDLKAGDVYLIIANKLVILQTLGIKVIPSETLLISEGWSLVPTNDLKSNLTTYKLFDTYKDKNIEQVAIYDSLKNLFKYTVKNKNNEILGEDINIFNYDAIFLKTKK